MFTSLHSTCINLILLKFPQTWKEADLHQEVHLILWSKRIDSLYSRRINIIGTYLDVYLLISPWEAELAILSGTVNAWFINAAVQYLFFRDRHKGIFQLAGNFLSTYHAGIPVCSQPNLYNNADDWDYETACRSAWHAVDTNSIRHRGYVLKGNCPTMQLALENTQLNNVFSTIVVFLESTVFKFSLRTLIHTRYIRNSRHHSR